MPGDMSLSGAFGSRRVVAVDTVRGVPDVGGLEIRDAVLVEFLDPDDVTKPCDPEGQRPSLTNQARLTSVDSWRAWNRNAREVTAAPRCWGVTQRVMRMAWVRAGHDLPSMDTVAFVKERDGPAWTSADGTAAFRDEAELLRSGWRDTPQDAVAVLLPAAQAAVEKAGGFMAALLNLAPKKKARRRKKVGVK